MASIVISELHPVGFELFSDSEGYLRDLSEPELGIEGGIIPAIAAAAAWSSIGCKVAAVGLAAGAVGYIKGRWL
ncbi:MAG: hypothetical protein KME50_00730 [Nostoc desertorum CM1-VF14]|jgi:hypothetical protein|nr:hypothetical protein [Nostoc desertorum CM1-VF14]